jgi:hypothetical protein
MTCLLGPIEVDPVKQWGDVEDFKAAVTLRNSGAATFTLKHDAANSLRRFQVIELYDEKGAILFRDYEMRYHGLNVSDPAKYPVLTIRPNGEFAGTMYITPGRQFGSLPPGKYSIRVYFPFEYEKGNFYPSNRVAFELTEEQVRRPKTKG